MKAMCSSEPLAFPELQGAIIQKTEILTVTAVITSNPPKLMRDWKSDSNTRAIGELYWSPNLAIY